MPLVKQPKTKQLVVAQPPKRINKHKEALRALWHPSSNLPKPPAKFDPDTIYRIKLTQAVTAKDHAFPFKPSQDVQVTGKIAEEIRDYICGAVALG